MKSVFPMSAVFLSLLSACQQPSNGPLRAEKAWMRAMPPGSDMTAVYVTLTNTSDHAVTMTHSSSPAFADISLHQSIEENGRAKMITQSECTINTNTQLTNSQLTNSQLKSKPNRYHLMLMDPISEVTAGMEVPVTFMFEHGETQIITFVTQLH